MNGRSIHVLHLFSFKSFDIYLYRETIREFGSDYFIDTIQDLDEYMEENPIGVPTEREVSVLDKDLPVYRTVFRRTSAEWKE